MGIDWCIACKDCKVFLDLHKWCPDEGAVEPPPDPNLYRSVWSLIPAGIGRLELWLSRHPNLYRFVWSFIRSPSGPIFGPHDPSLYPEHPSYVVWKLVPDRALAQIAADEAEFSRYPHHWILDMVPLVRDFIQHHREHCIFLINDGSNYPWGFLEPEFPLWKQLDGPFTFDNQVLPRNLIEDLGIRTAEDAIRHVREVEPKPFFDLFFGSGQGDEAFGTDEAVAKDEASYRKAFAVALRRSEGPS